MQEIERLTRQHQGEWLAIRMGSSATEEPDGQLLAYAKDLDALLRQLTASLDELLYITNASAVVEKAYVVATAAGSDRKEPADVVRAVLRGPRGRIMIDAVVDPSAKYDLIDGRILEKLGYNLAKEAKRVQLSTPSMVQELSVIMLEAIEVEERHLSRCRVASQSLPRISKVLGFLRPEMVRQPPQG